MTPRFTAEEIRHYISMNTNPIIRDILEQAARDADLDQSASPVLAFDAWVRKRVEAGAKPFTQDEYFAAQAGFYAAHPGKGPTSSVMNDQSASGEKEPTMSEQRENRMAVEGLVIHAKGDAPAAGTLASCAAFGDHSELHRDLHDTCPACGLNLRPDNSSPISAAVTVIASASDRPVGPEQGEIRDAPPPSPLTMTAEQEKLAHEISTVERIVVPATIATDDSFRDIYCQAYRHACDDVRPILAALRAALTSAQQRIATLEAQVAQTRSALDWIVTESSSCADGDRKSDSLMGELARIHFVAGKALDVLAGLEAQVGEKQS